MRAWILVPLLGCGGPKTAADCLPTFGDKCDGCVPKCMTQQEIDHIGAVCDIACGGDTGNDEGWTCVVEDGSCAVGEVLE
jgi:hypothetical protein